MSAKQVFDSGIQFASEKKNFLDNFASGLKSLLRALMTQLLGYMNMGLQHSNDRKIFFHLNRTDQNN